MPKILTITLGETIIEFHNTTFGKETIIVNDREVSSKKSISGTVHNFTVKESGENAHYELIKNIYDFIKDPAGFYTEEEGWMADGG